MERRYWPTPSLSRCDNHLPQISDSTLDGSSSRDFIQELKKFNIYIFGTIQLSLCVEIANSRASLDTPTPWSFLRLRTMIVAVNVNFLSKETSSGEHSLVLDLIVLQLGLQARNCESIWEASLGAMGQLSICIQLCKRKFSSFLKEEIASKR